MFNHSVSSSSSTLLSLTRDIIAKKKKKVQKTLAAFKGWQIVSGFPETFLVLALKVPGPGSPSFLGNLVRMLVPQSWIPSWSWEMTLRGGLLNMIMSEGNDCLFWENLVVGGFIFNPLFMWLVFAVFKSWMSFSWVMRLVRIAGELVKVLFLLSPVRNTLEW